MVEDVATGQALGTLATLVGGAGISGVIIAVIGYMTAARGGRKGDAEHAGMALQRCWRIAGPSRSSPWRWKL
jgi:hypothetical protein